MATVTAPPALVSPPPQALAPKQQSVAAPVPAAAPPVQQSAGSRGDMIALMFLVLCMAGAALAVPLILGLPYLDDLFTRWLIAGASAALALLLRVLLRFLAPIHALIAITLAWAVVLTHVLASR